MITVSAAIIELNGKYLAAKRSPAKDLAGYWEFPGGKLEAGETPEHCLQRELHEEFSIQSKVGEFVAENCFDYGDKKIKLMAYHVTHLSGQFKLTDHDEIRWLPLDELDSLKWAPADIPIIDALRKQVTAQATSKFYRDNAESYFEETAANNVSSVRERFTRLLPPNGHILDLGCGSGRDSKAFLQSGFQVTALEASKELAELASKNIGQAVLNLRYQQLTDKNKFHGIWACASLLHCPKSQIEYVISRCIKALKNEGIFYLSFKYGLGERLDERGRFFNDYTADSLNALINKFPELSIIELWQETSPLRNSEQTWVNGLLKKVAR